jgi:hypothetical protein
MYRVTILSKSSSARLPSSLAAIAAVLPTVRSSSSISDCTTLSLPCSGAVASSLSICAPRVGSVRPPLRSSGLNRRPCPGRRGRPKK